MWAVVQELGLGKLKDVLQKLTGNKIDSKLTSLLTEASYYFVKIIQDEAGQGFNIIGSMYSKYSLCHYVQ